MFTGGLSAVCAVIAAGGSGSRFGLSLHGMPKQFLFLDSVVSQFLEHCDCVICSVPSEWVSSFCDSENVKFVVGGETRQESVFNALSEAAKFCPSHVLVHDAARPYVSDDVIHRVIQAMEDGASAVVPRIRSVDSLRYKGHSINRDEVDLVQTPQGFVFEKLYELHERYKFQNFSDDASLFDMDDIKVTTVEGCVDNKKLTYKSDMDKPVFKIGFGFDSHEFSSDPSRPLKLCGVEIPGATGLDGVSDADVATHSIIDSVLGALGRGSIGEHFTENSPKDSLSFLHTVKDMIDEEELKISNVDVTIVCDSPRITQFHESMRKNISSALNINKKQVNVKGKTTEGFNITGMAAFANTLLYKQ